MFHRVSSKRTYFFCAYYVTTVPRDIDGLVSCFWPIKTCVCIVSFFPLCLPRRWWLFYSFLQDGHIFAISTQSPHKDPLFFYSMFVSSPPVSILVRGLPCRRATSSSSENADTSAAEPYLPPSGDQKSLPSRPICPFLSVRPTLLGALRSLTFLS
jgi:hypothetical protein